VDLADMLPVKTWRWFTVRVYGLLSHSESIIRRRLIEDQKEASDE
jgi:hypothetical protein